MFKIVAYTNDRTRKIAHEATCTDERTAEILVDHYEDRGYVVGYKKVD